MHVKVTASDQLVGESNEVTSSFEDSRYVDFIAILSQMMI